MLVLRGKAGQWMHIGDARVKVYVKDKRLRWVFDAPREIRIWRGKEECSTSTQED